MFLHGTHIVHCNYVMQHYSSVFSRVPKKLFRSSRRQKHTLIIFCCIHSQFVVVLPSLVNPWLMLAIKLWISITLSQVFQAVDLPSELAIATCMWNSNRIVLITAWAGKPVFWNWPCKETTRGCQLTTNCTLNGHQIQSSQCNDSAVACSDLHCHKKLTAR